MKLWWVNWLIGFVIMCCSLPMEESVLKYCIWCFGVGIMAGGAIMTFLEGYR